MVTAVNYNYIFCEHYDTSFDRYIENSKLCFCDMKIMSRRNGGDSVNNESAGQVVYQVTTIPE